jgi:hypothetical protein
MHGRFLLVSQDLPHGQDVQNNQKDQTGCIDDLGYGRVEKCENLIEISKARVAPQQRFAI